MLAVAATAMAQPPTPAHHPDDLRGLVPAPLQDTGRPAPQAALLNGVPILWEDLRPALTELAGAQTLREAILDRLLAEQLRTRNLTITNEDLAAEQNMLTASISRDAKATPQDAERLLDQLRHSRGLGDTRFQSLLRRTAAMRKLVADSVTIPDDETRQAFDITHGPKYRARVILVPTQREASDLRAKLLTDDPASPPDTHPTSDIPHPTSSQLAFRFSDEATKTSADPSAQRGGLLDPISPADPAYPAAARKALTGLAPGRLSDVVPVDKGFALFLLQEQIPPDGADFESLKPQIQSELRKRHERLAMDDLARRLLSSANVSVLDRDLNWAWRSAPPPAAP